MNASDFPSQEKLHLLVRLSSLINSSLDIQEVLVNALICVEQLLEAEASSIFEVDKEKGELFFRLARGEATPRITGMRLKIGEGIAGWVALTEEPLMVADTAQDSRFYQQFDVQSGFTTRSILCVPVQSKGQLIGVLEALNKRGDRGFAESDMELLTLLGNLIGTALENARLYSRVKEQLSVTEEELRVAAERLIRSERLAALGKLSQGVAHEVRNPVMAIGGFVKRLQKSTAADDVHREIFGIIGAELGKLERMVREIEGFAALSEINLMPTNLAEVVDRVLAENAATLRHLDIRVQREIPAALPLYRVDGTLLSHALQYLIDNAGEAMPRGGLLKVALVPEPNGVWIILTDSGIGIRPEDMPHLFDPFFSSKPQGTGMGLTTVHRIISDHRGEITISSAPGQGTEVQIWLPRWQI